MADEQKVRRVRVGQWLGLVGAVLLIAFGLHVVSAAVDTAPYVGTPQIDYPGLNIDLPFWPQFLFYTGGLGLAGAVITAFGLLQMPGNLRVAWLGALLWAAVLILRLAWDLAFYAPPWETAETVWRARYAAVNGLVSAGMVLACHATLGPLLRSGAGTPRWMRFLLWSGGVAALLLAVGGVLQMSGGLLGPGWLENTLLIAATTAPLIGLLAAVASVAPVSASNAG